MTSQYQQYADNYSLSIEEFCQQMMGMDYQTFTEQVKAYSEGAIKQEIVLISIIRAEKMRLTDKEYDEGIAKLAEEKDTTVEELESSYDFAMFWESFMWEKVINFIVDNGKPVAETTSAETTSADTTAEDTAAADTTAAE